MGECTSSSNNYRIEVSGWDSGADFFVEKTDLLWTETGGKRLLLQHSLPDGAVIFIRLLSTEDAADSVPMAYRINNTGAVNCSGLSEVQLREVHLRQLSRQPWKCAKLENSIIYLWLSAVAGLFESNRGLLSSKALKENGHEG